MDAFADKLGRVGAWCGQNKYLGSKTHSKTSCQQLSQVLLVFFGLTF